MIRFIDEPGMIEPIKGDLRADVAITAFSAFIFDELLLRTGAKKVSSASGGCDADIYMFSHGGRNIVVYKSPIGAPAATAVMEEIIAATGVNKVIAFGICGALVDVPHNTFIVPDRAYRDEGTSYHYAPASEYMEIHNAAAVKASLESGGVGALIGGTWTTDGFYRETRTRADEMKNNGCVAVDMECSALQAAADRRGIGFYTFFISADSLAGEQWEPNDILDLKVTDATTVAVCSAIRLAKTV